MPGPDDRDPLVMHFSFTAPPRRHPLGGEADDRGLAGGGGGGGGASGLPYTAQITDEELAEIDRLTREAAGEGVLEDRLAAARLLARLEVSDALVEALADYDGTLDDLHKAGGPAPAVVSRLARGRVSRNGATVATLTRIALAMNKSLKITIE